MLAVWPAVSAALAADFRLVVDPRENVGFPNSRRRIKRVFVAT